jgi:ribonuclease HI
LADFIVDYTGPLELQQIRTKTIWTIHCDGALCHRGADVIAIITSPIGLKYRYVARLRFALESDKCTNNIAEYEAIILGLRKLWTLGVTTCIVKTDSKLVTGQIKKDCSTKEPVLMQYLSVVRSLERQFKGFTLQHIERNKNEEADMLAKAAAKGEPLPSDMFSHDRYTSCKKPRRPTDNTRPRWAQNRKSDNDRRLVGTHHLIPSRSLSPLRPKQRQKVETHMP